MQDNAQPNPTMAGLFFLWRRDIVHVKGSVSTHERYASIVDLHLVPLLGHLPVETLRAWHVRELHGQLFAKGLSSRTVGLCQTVLSGACKYAVERELIEHNPVSKVPWPREIPPELEIPTVKQVQDLLAQAQGSGHPLFEFLHLLAFTGVRRGEAMALRWRDIDQENGCIRITRTAVKTGKQGIVFTTPKTKRAIRTVDLDGSTLQLFKLVRDAVAGAQDNDLVFQSPRGGVLKPTHLDRQIKKLGEAAGIPGLTCHTLRHFHASVALQQGQNVTVVSRRLGHSSVSITLDIYGHLIPGWQQELADAFAEKMSR